MLLDQSTGTAIEADGVTDAPDSAFVQGQIADGNLEVVAAPAPAKKAADKA